MSGARAGFAAAALLLGVACAREAAWEWHTPAVLDESALRAELRPRGDEKLVLANFWASW